MAERPIFGQKIPNRHHKPKDETATYLDGLRFQQASFTSMLTTGYQEEAAQLQQQIFPQKGQDLSADLSADRQDRQEEEVTRLHETIAPYVDLVTLRRLASGGENLRAALRGEVPSEITALLNMIALLLRPPTNYKIKSPSDMAAVFMLEMGHLDQEQLKVACLDTKNHLQRVHLVYQGSLDTSLIRVGEVFKEPIKLNSAALIVAHNHPSSDPTPSPEDVCYSHPRDSKGRKNP